MNDDQFTADNWGNPPYNRRSFQHVQALFPTTRLRRGPGPVLDLATATRDISRLEYTGTAGTKSIRQMLDDTFTDAFLVLHNDVIICEEYDNGMRPDSHHLLNSVTKTFVGMLAGILIDEGLLDPEQKIAHYMPEFHTTAFANTSLRHALDMTAAVSFGEDYADPQADFWKETAVVGWRPALVNDELPSTLLKFALSLQETEQNDGDGFHYRTVLTNLIAMTIERVTDQRIQNLLEVRIWEKLGAEQDAVIVVDRTGFPYVGAGMNACARDLARFGQLLLHDGQLNGTQIVPARWIHDTLEASDSCRTHFAATDYTQMLPGGQYRNQVWGVRDEGVMICIGIYGQTIYVDQTHDVVMVKLSTHSQPVDNELFGDTFAAMRAVCHAL